MAKAAAASPMEAPNGDGGIFDPVAVLRRAEKLSVPAHLTDGLTVAGMAEWLHHGFPPNAVEWSNGVIPMKYGKPRHPRNEAINGYVSQFFLFGVGGKGAKGGTQSMCEKLKQQHQLQERADGRSYPSVVGTADVFVSWHLQTPLETLIDALRGFLGTHRLPQTTKFWVADFCMRPASMADDLKHLGACVEMIRHTVLVLDPWHNPSCLKRAFCIQELYHTHLCKGKLRLAISRIHRATFRSALHSPTEFQRIVNVISSVDVRKADCRNRADRKAILRALEGRVNLAECNRLVSAKLGEAVQAEAKAALSSPPVSGSHAVNNPLREKKPRRADEELTAAKILCEETLAEHRAKHGDAHEETLAAVHNLGSLLLGSGDLDGAKPLLEEGLAGRRAILGNKHPDTLASVYSLGTCRKAKGDLPASAPLLAEVLAGRRELLGDKHEDTLTLMNNLALVIQAMGDLTGARPLYEEALAGRREVLGNKHPETLGSINNLGSLYLSMGEHAGAKALLREALETRRETFGDIHPETLISIRNYGIVLHVMGNFGEAVPLFREEVAGLRQHYGAKDETVLASVRNLCLVMKEAGDAVGVAAIIAEYNLPLDFL